MDGQEPNSVSKQLLLERDGVSGIFWPVTSPVCRRDPIAPFEVLLMFECPRRLWHAGPSKIGRPVADVRSCGQVRLMLVLAHLASKEKCTTVMEILRDQSFPASRNALPSSVRAYRLWIMASRVQIANMSSQIAQMWTDTGDRPLKRRRTSEGFKPFLPGVYDVSPRIYSQRMYQDLVMAYTMGTFAGFSYGITYELDEQPTAHGSEVSNDGFEFADFFADGQSQPSQPSSESSSNSSGVLPSSHVFAPFEATRYFDDNPIRAELLKNRYEAMNLDPRFCCLESYVRLGQFTLPDAFNGKDLPWGSNAFVDGNALTSMLLPDYYPDVDLLSKTVADAIAFQGGDMRQSLRFKTMDELLSLFDNGSIVDPSMFAPISAPLHWSGPMADAASLGETAIAKIFPAISLAQKSITEHISTVRTDDKYMIETAILERMNVLFHGDPDGAPPIFSKVTRDLEEITATIPLKTVESKLLRKLLFSPSMTKKFLPPRSSRMDFTSMLMIQVAKMTAYGLKLTPIQQAAYNHIIWSFGRLYYLWAVPAFLAIFEGNFMLGKTHLMDKLAASLCDSAVLQQGTRSKLSDLKNVTGQVSFMDDSVSHEDDEGAWRSATSTGIRSHSINVPTPSGGRVVEDQLFIRNLAQVMSTNFKIGMGIATRAVRYIFADKADEGADYGKLDFITGTGNKSFEGATSKFMKCLNGWTKDFAEQHALKGLVLNTTMYHVVISVMRTILGDYFTMSERDCRHVFYGSIANMTIRVTNLWKRVLEPRLDTADGVFVDKERIRFYRLRSIVTGQDVWRAAQQIMWMADRSRFRRIVEGCIRDSIVMMSGNKEPVSAEDEAYFVTELSEKIETASRAISSKNDSLKGDGIIPSFLHEILKESVDGEPLMKIDSKTKKLIVLKSWILSDRIVTTRERIIMKTLHSYWTMSRNSSNPDDHIAAVEYEEPADPWIVFNCSARASIDTNPLDSYKFEVPSEYRELAKGPSGSMSMDRITQTLAFMQLRGNFKTKEENGTDALSMSVAIVIDSTKVPNASMFQPIRDDGYISKNYDKAADLMKFKKSWQHSLAVKESLLRQYADTNSIGESCVETKMRQVFEAVIGIEGIASVGDDIVVGVPPEKSSNEPAEVWRVRGLPDDWSLQVHNRTHVMEPPSDDDSDSDDDEDRLDDAQFYEFSTNCDATNQLAFPRGSEVCTFRKGRLYEDIEEMHAMIQTGKPMESRFKFVNTDFMW